MVAIDTEASIKKAVISAKIRLFKDIEGMATPTIVNNDHGDNSEGILIEMERFNELKRRHLDPSPLSKEGSKADLRIR
jgi:hypothetical protein